MKNNIFEWLFWKFEWFDNESISETKKKMILFYTFNEKVDYIFFFFFL